MEQLIGMGMEEGLRSAMSQIDALVADLKLFAADAAAQALLVDDTHVRVSRVIVCNRRAGLARTSRTGAHDAMDARPRRLDDVGMRCRYAVLVCGVATNVGERYRYEWEKADGSERFGFEVELLEMAAS